MGILPDGKTHSWSQSKLKSLPSCFTPALTPDPVSVGDCHPLRALAPKPEAGRHLPHFLPHPPNHSKLISLQILLILLPASDPRLLPLSAPLPQFGPLSLFSWTTAVGVSWSPDLWPNPTCRNAPAFLSYTI